MIHISNNDAARSVRFFGRTITDKQTGTVFFNWSGSGFETVFEGKRLDVVFTAIEAFFPPEGTLWPWISVFIDDMEVPAATIYVNQTEQRVTLFASERTKRCHVRVVKRSENDKGKIGIIGFDIDGQILPPQLQEKRRRIEFIGDSITCGFGNEAKTRDNAFATATENGLSAYSAVAAKMLNADYHSICISGISLCKPYDPAYKLVLPDFPKLELRRLGMEDYYGYTDRLLEEANGRTKEFEKWDFSRFKPDAVVVNLGTNDSFRIKASKAKTEEEHHFEMRYQCFLHTIRKLNGPAPVIACTLGSMDYYLYDNIQRAVEKFKTETGDSKVFCLKFGGIFPFDEGFGAQDHPSVITHERMGRELGAALNDWLP